MALDTIWGGMAALGLDLSRVNELLMAISFVLGLPAYMLDLRNGSRIAKWLLTLLVLRWWARCYGTQDLLLCNPLRGSVLLVVSLVLLQLSKLRRQAKPVSPNSH